MCQLNRETMRRPLEGSEEDEEDFTPYKPGEYFAPEDLTALAYIIHERVGGEAF